MDVGRLFGLLVLFHLDNVASLTCLHCEGVDQPRYCTRVAECSNGEMCRVERIINEFGEAVYNLGCLSSTSCQNISSAGKLSPCLYCCASDICNSNACGEPGYPETRGPVCYNCASNHTDICHDIDVCEAGQVCNVIGRNLFGEQLFTTHCVFNHSCRVNTGGNIIIGKRSVDDNEQATSNRRSGGTHVCDRCCTSDLCNKECSTPGVNGNWAEWLEWSHCSASCGNGTRTRSRTCTTPAPSNGGYNCTGVSQELQNCNTDPCPAADCLDILRMGLGNTSGVYNVRTWKTHTMLQVYCDLTTQGGGWTVFQKRYDGSVDFHRNFSEYEHGFGNMNGEFWLGLLYTQEMSSRYSNNTLRINLQVANGTWGFDEYSGFSLSPARRFTLHVGPRIDSHGMQGQYTLSNGSSAGTPNNCDFSTFDNDQDKSPAISCSQSYGAWWFNFCYDFANLNGRYESPGSRSNSGVMYLEMTGGTYISLKASNMMFRRA